MTTMQPRPVRVPDLKARKARGEKIAMLTAYDATMARLLDRAGVDALLVGDTVGMVVLGYENTVREPDGLALSSRNQRLNPEERRLAPALYRALCEACRGVAEGARDAEPVRRAAAATVPRDERLRLEYLELVEPENMQPVERIDGPVLAAGALWVGPTRLIDNVLCDSSRAR